LVFFRSKAHIVQVHAQPNLNDMGFPSCPRGDLNHPGEAALTWAFVIAAAQRVHLRTARYATGAWRYHKRYQSPCGNSSGGCLDTGQRGSRVSRPMRACSPPWRCCRAHGRPTWPPHCTMPTKPWMPLSAAAAAAGTDTTEKTVVPREE